MIIKQMTVGNMAVCCYIVGCEDTGKGIVIDPGGDDGKVINMIRKEKITIEYIVNTHGHPDHFGLAAGIRDMVEHPIEVFIHPEDAWRVSPRNFEDELWCGGFEDLRAMVDMPQDELEKLKQGIARFYSLCDALTDVSFMVNGDEFDGDF